MFKGKYDFRLEEWEDAEHSTFEMKLPKFALINKKKINFS